MPLVPFVRKVPLRGPGPFRLPKMKAFVSIDPGQAGEEWSCPQLRFETEQGVEVFVPLAAEAVEALRDLASAWLALPHNPINRPRS